MTASAALSPVISRVINTAEPPAAPIDIVASAPERTKLAETYEVVAVNALSARITVIAGPLGGGLVVEGHVVADVVQNCVVSLVPVDQHIDETFSVRFVHGPAPTVKPGAEIVVDALQPDPPEYLDGPTLDVGELAEEYFALAIDPYPHAPGATLPDAAPADTTPQGSPFAALAALVKPPRDTH
jgi:uncharacterized metal-binding protein YceD (DUF177 family)